MAQRKPRQLRGTARAEEVPVDNFETLETRQKAFGYTFEDMRFIVGPSAEAGKQPLGSMGTTHRSPSSPINRNFSIITLSSSSHRSQIRRLTRSVKSSLPQASALLGPKATSPARAQQLPHDQIESPLIDHKQLAQLRHIDMPGFKATRLPILFESLPVASNQDTMRLSIHASLEKVSKPPLNNSSKMPMPPS